MRLPWNFLMIYPQKHAEILPWIKKAFQQVPETSDNIENISDHPASYQHTYGIHARTGVVCRYEWLACLRMWTINTDLVGVCTTLNHEHVYVACLLFIKYKEQRRSLLQIAERNSSQSECSQVCSSVSGLVYFSSIGPHLILNCI